MKKSKKIILGIVLVALQSISILRTPGFSFSSCLLSLLLFTVQENGWEEGRSDSPVL